jgi:FkbM family methyltransferase
MTPSLRLLGLAGNMLRGTPLARSPMLGRMHSWLFQKWKRDTVVSIDGANLEFDARDAMIAKKIALYGMYEPHLHRLLLESVGAGDTAIDVGANVGLHTIALAQRVGPRGCVFAFEPDPANFSLLQRNIARNHCTNVRAFQTALSDRTGEALLYQSSNNRGALSLCSENVRTPAPLAPVAVATRRGDELIPQAVKRLRLVKIDVEGAEPLVVKGLRETLRRHRGITVVLEFLPTFIRNFGCDPLEFLLDLEREGFHFTMLEESSGIMHRIGRLDELAAEERLDLNLVARRSAPM